jgi:hypothetical protein
MSERRKSQGECCVGSLLQADFKRDESYRRHLREAAEKLYEMNKCLSLVHLTRRHGAPEREFDLKCGAPSPELLHRHEGFYDSLLRIHFFEDEVALPA